LTRIGGQKRGQKDMLVMDWMSKPAVTVEQNSSLIDAIRLLKREKIMMLPVMKGNELVGIISNRDFKRAFSSNVSPFEAHEVFYLMESVKVKNIMSRNPIVVPLNYTIEETAEVLLHHRISAVPVLDHKRDLVGVITQRDIFKAFLSLTGIGKGGIQFALLLEDRPGSIKEVADILRKYGGSMVSILSSYDRVPVGYRLVFIRVYGLDHTSLDTVKTALRETAKIRYLVDHARNNREIFLEKGDQDVWREKRANADRP
jgi:acetoin utilization protein AcuB